MSKKFLYLEMSDEELEDILNCISITQMEYSGKKDSPIFMKAVDKLRKKVWKLKRSKKGSI